MMRWLRRALLCVVLSPLACAAPARVTPTAPPWDVVLRGGTIVDGSGSARYVGDVGVKDGFIVAVGDLRGQRATVELDVSGLMVAPGFINLHSHAAPAALPTAVNMLTQGVTTELLNPDGGGPIDIAQQLDARATAGLAVNIGAYAPFNTTWSTVMGASDRRATTEDIARMRELIAANLERGAFGVSAGLDYKPAHYARIEEVVQAAEPARRWRTNFTNHDRLTPETGYSSRVGMQETMQIGEQTGMVPVITHMKIQGREQGTAAAFLKTMTDTARNLYTAADAYPYLAGQTSLAALIIPGWAQEGGREAMLERFRDPAQRSRIIAEAEAALNARFGGAAGVYLPTMRKELTDIMREQQLTSAGEAVIRILETESPSSILRFGTEADLVLILQHPTTSIACDCGAVLSATHPRGFGTYPRVLGRYVREQKQLTWEDAIRKMSGLPANTIGMIDRGFLVPGMAADIVVFDTAAVIDHATYENPTAMSEGIRHVLVNGVLALRDGEATKQQGGRALRRGTYMPSRPMSTQRHRTVTANGSVTSKRADGTDSVTLQLIVDASQVAGAPRPRGMIRLHDASTGVTLASTELGLVQTTTDWASITGMLQQRGESVARAFTLVLERADPFAGGVPTMTIDVAGRERIRGTLQNTQLTVQQSK